MEWKTGKPKGNGEYIVTMWWGEVTTMSLWDNKWNATKTCKDNALPDDSVMAWMEMPEPYKEGANNG